MTENVSAHAGTVSDHRRRKGGQGQCPLRRAAGKLEPAAGSSSRRVIDLRFGKRLHAVIDYMTRREQVREAIARHRTRRKRGFLWPDRGDEGPTRSAWRARLPEPGDRGTRADECEAIASFLTDSLAKPNSLRFG